MIGQQLDHYCVLARIGEGGMGTVYRAIDETLDREVAIKLLRPELADRSDVVERFRSEALTLARLAHPNIATLYGLSRRDQDLFMVMEYVRGETLEQILRRVGRIEWRQAVRVARQALSALSYAHGLNVVHRDIKPSNLMLDPAGRLKVMDFGLARFLGSSRSTRIGHIVGTLEYMSPEQIRGEDADGRSDQYALGVVLYELLAGAPPFKAKSDYALMTAHLEHEAPQLGPTSPDVPGWLDRAIRRALGKRREDRFPTAGEFRAALVAAADVSTPLPAPQPVTRSFVDEDATDPLAFDIAVAAESRAVPPTRLAEAPSSPVVIVKETRLASTIAPQTETREVATSAPPSANRKVLLALSAISLVGLLAVLIAVNAGPWRESIAEAVPATAETPNATAARGDIGLTAQASDVAATPVLPDTPRGIADAPPVRVAPRPPIVNLPTEPVVPPLDTKRHPVAPPASVESPPPPAPAAPVRPPMPARTFERLRLVLQEGEKDREIDVQVTLQADRMQIQERASKNVVRTIAYADVTAAVYSYSAQKGQSGGSGIGRVFKAPAKIFQRTRHALTVRAGGGSTTLRFDGDEVDQILPAFEERSGVKVTRVQ